MKTHTLVLTEYGSMRFSCIRDNFTPLIIRDIRSSSPCRHDCGKIAGPVLTRGESEHAIVWECAVVFAIVTKRWTCHLTSAQAISREIGFSLQPSNAHDHEQGLHAAHPPSRVQTCTFEHTFRMHTLFDANEVYRRTKLPLAQNSLTRQKEP